VGRPRPKGKTAFSVLTCNGRVSLRRRRWSCPVRGAMTIADRSLMIAGHTVSLATREMICRLNQASTSFRKTASNLTRLAQITTNAETVRQLVETEGQAIVSAQQDGTLTAVWQAQDCRLETGQTRVYLGSDGVKVPMVTETEKAKRRHRHEAKRRKRKQKGRCLRRLPRRKTGSDQAYKQFKLVVFYDESNQHRHCVATRHDHRMAGVIMSREARHLDLKKADERIGNVDGADWIRNRIQDADLDLHGLGLDFYHLSENVHKARRETFGEDSEQGRQWVANLLHTVKHEGYGAMWDQLTPWRMQWRSKTKKAAADRLMHYVAHRRDMIDYPKFLKQGWQIGSGPTEAMCKTTTARIKGSGMRWEPENAEALMALNGLDQSNQWSSYWKNQLSDAA